MSVAAMANPFSKLRKLRSFDEIVIRGSQAISAFREQRMPGRILSDEEFASLIDRNVLRHKRVIPERLWQKFYSNGENRFFPSFRHPRRSAEFYREQFGSAKVDAVVAAAERIVAGRLDLMGFKNLYVGVDIDWHLEPLSAKRSPLKHWRKFDDLDSAESGNKKIVWELNRHQHFFILGLAFWLTRDERFAETFARHLSSWIKENPPGMGINWASSLEVSYRAISWIWAFHFFKDARDFSPELFKDALKCLYRHALHIERYLSTYYSPNTHLTGEALGLYYLGTQLPFLARAAEWTRLGEQILFSQVTKQIHPDGVYFEQSTWYQRYTADIYSHFVMLKALARTSVSDHVSSELQSRLEKAFEFLMSVTMPDGTTPIIGDDDGGRLLPLTLAEPDDFRGTLALGAFIFERMDMKATAGPPSEELFWLAGSGGVETYRTMKAGKSAVESQAFPYGGYAVMRDNSGNCLVVDCGELGALSGAHAHADALSVEVAVRGRSLIVDSGTYTYHESKEMRDHFRSTTAHNTLTLDERSSSEPGGTFAWRTRANARRKRWISDGRFDLFEGCHDGYDRLEPGAVHTRTILFLKNDYFFIRDLFYATGEHQYSLNFHYGAGIKSLIGDDLVWVGNDDHRMFVFGDNGFLRRNESWISTNHGNKVNAPFVRFSSVGKGSQEFFTFILPVDSAYEPPSVNEERAAMGRAFSIRFSGHVDTLVFNDTPNRIGNGVFESNFEYTWMRNSVDSPVPTEFVVINGHTLRLGETEIFGQLKREYGVVGRNDDRLTVRNDRDRG